MRKLALLLLTAGFVLAALAGAARAEVRTLDGSGNNRAHPTWGKSNTAYLRVAAANYADRVAEPVAGPSSRYVSNRIFNDTSQNLFSENGVTQWGFVWGQFMDHTFGLRAGGGRRERADPVQLGRPARGVHEHARRDRVQANARRARHGDGHEGAAADQHGPELHRRLHRLRRNRLAARMAARGPGRREDDEQRGQAAHAERLPPACRRPWERRDGARDGAHGPARGARRRTRRPSSPATSARTRTSRSRDPDALRARAQPDRGEAAEQPLRGAEVPDRPPDRRGGAAVDHLPGVPPVAGREAPGVQGLQAHRERDARRTSSRSSATGLTA